MQNKLLICQYCQNECYDPVFLDCFHCICESCSNLYKKLDHITLIIILYKSS